MTAPLAIDLFCGLGGWTDGLLAEGYDVIGFDIERHDYGDGNRYPAQLVLQDVMTLDGSQFKNASLIVASPPRQEFSYMAMPWSRAKAIAVEYRSGKRDVKKLTALFDACFRIQREAIEAAGYHIPLVVENVRGAIPWVGRSRWNFGSYHLWGDVPALMPMAVNRRMKFPAYCGPRKWSERQFVRLNDGNASAFHHEGATKNNGGSWFNIGSPGQKVVAQNPDGRLINKRNGHVSSQHLTNAAEHTGIKHGGDWFNADQPSLARLYGSKSKGRKAASAEIARIPFDLARHVAWAWKPK